MRSCILRSRIYKNILSPYSIKISQDDETKKYLARCVRHVAKSHSQLVITKIRTEQIIITHVGTKGVTPASIQGSI